MAVNRLPTSKKLYISAVVLVLLTAAVWYCFPKKALAPASVNAGITADAFSAYIAHGVHLVAFEAEWCGPCGDQREILRELAGKYENKAVLTEVDVDENPAIADRFDVHSIPCLVFLKNGREETRRVGFHSEDELAGILDGLLRQTARTP